MTISNTNRTAGPFTGNGTTKQFPFSFKVFSRSDLLVAQTLISTGAESILLLDADYTVALNPSQNTNPGGVITLAVALPVGSTMAATSNISITQQLDLTNNGGFYPAAINDALDRIVITIQQLASKVGGVNIGSAATIATLLAFVTNIAGGAGASLIGFIHAGVGAVRRTIESRLRETVSLYDFMTYEQYLDSKSGNPTIDATGPLGKATDYLASVRGGRVRVRGVALLKGSGGLNSGRTTDGVVCKSTVAYDGEGVGEIRLDPSCVIGFTTRTLAPVTSLDAATHDIGFYNLLITRPGSTWDESLQNTALIYIAAVNRMKVQNCRFIGWNADAIGLGINDTPDLSALNETYVQDVEISGNFFDGVTKANRQAISVFEGVDINIHDNVFTRTTRSGGTAPMPGAVDIEPILASAKVANIRVDNNTFDDIGGATGVVSFALGVALTSPAHDLYARNNTFRNISNTSDIYGIGMAAPSHAAVAAGSPYTLEFTGNTHDPLSGLTPNRRYWVGGLSGLVIERNTIYGSNAQMLLGYDDGTNHWPIENLSFSHNKMRLLDVAGSAFDPAIAVFGGIKNGKFCGNQFVDCGNINGTPQNMTVLGFVGNGVASRNIDISGNQVVNSAGFAIASFPFYAGALLNPTTFSVKQNVFHGLGSEAYNSQYSIYAQVPCDYYDGFITIPSTTVPLVGGGRNFRATTGDTFTNFQYGKDGQRILIQATDAGCTIANNANIKPTSGANLVLAAGKNAEFANFGGVWQQV